MAAISINNLLAKQYICLDFQGEWYDAFGKPEACGVWFIWGNSGNGKSTFTLRLCKEILRAMRELPNRKAARGAYVALEEADAKTVQNNFRRNGMSTVNSGIKLIVDESIEQVSARLEKEKNLRFVVFDSFQYTRLSFQKYLEFKRKHADKLIIFTSQADGKKPAGRAAVSVMYDAGMKIWIEGFRAFCKGREIGPKGNYTIWEEKAALYHGHLVETELAKASEAVATSAKKKQKPELPAPAL